MYNIIICKIWVIARLLLCLLAFSTKLSVTLNLSIITTTFPGFLSYPSVSVSLSLRRDGKEGSLGKRLLLSQCYLLLLRTLQKKPSLYGYYFNKYYTHGWGNSKGFLCFVFSFKLNCLSNVTVQWRLFTALQDLQNQCVTESCHHVITRPDRNVW